MLAVSSAAALFINVPKITRKHQRGNCNQLRFSWDALMPGARILLLICPFFVGLMQFLLILIHLLQPYASNLVLWGRGGWPPGMLCKVLALHGLLTRHMAHARAWYWCHTAVYTASTLSYTTDHIQSWRWKYFQVINYNWFRELVQNCPI